MNLLFCFFLRGAGFFISHTHKKASFFQLQIHWKRFLGSGGPAERELKVPPLQCPAWTTGTEWRMGKLFKGNDPEQQRDSEQQRCAGRAFQRRNEQSMHQFFRQGLVMQPTLARNLRILLPQSSHCWESTQLNSPVLKFFYSEHTPKM